MKCFQMQSVVIDEEEKQMIVILFPIVYVCLCVYQQRGMSNRARLRRMLMVSCCASLVCRYRQQLAVKVAVLPLAFLHRVMDTKMMMLLTTASVRDVVICQLR